MRGTKMDRIGMVIDILGRLRWYNVACEKNIYLLDF